MAATPQRRDLIVMGASAGGIEALSALFKELPREFPAAVCIVLHLSARSQNLLPQILTRVGRLPVTLATEGVALQPGHVYVASADRHLLVEPEGLHLTTGPKENHFRPAIDPLFRSAALAYGPRVIGVLLSGGQHDGAAGLLAIKDLGGLALVQDPQEARIPSMPQNALATVAIDYCASVVELGRLLVQLTAEAIKETAMPVPEELVIENHIAEGDNALAHGVLGLGAPSNVTCPDCHGTLLRLKEKRLVRFRCHTGHAFTLESLLDNVHEAVEEALWSGLRALEEQQMLLQHHATQVEEQDPALTAQLQQEMKTLTQRIHWVRQALLAPDGDKKDTGRHT